MQAVVFSRLADASLAAKTRSLSACGQRAVNMSLENACERHHGEPGQPGICPSCLREKLAQLTADRSKAAGIGIYSDSSPLTSRHLRHGSDVDRSAPDLAGAVGDALRKSSSMTAAGGDGERLLQKKKKGFWSRLTKLTWQKM